MKKVFIIHGWASSPQEPILDWLRKELESRNFEVKALQMPNPEEPKIEEWIPHLQKNCSNPNEETFFIGHSVGCQTILRYLEKIPEQTKIGGAVFIAPWTNLNKETLEEEGPEVVEIARPWIETPINWEKVKSHTNNFTAIFSSNDHYVPISNKDVFESNLNAKTIVEENKGHFHKSDNVSEVPSALNALLEMSQEL